MKTTKKILAILLAVTMILALAACGKEATPVETEPQVEVPGSALEILETVWALYGDDEKFPVMGGDMVNMVDGAPGAYGLEDAESLTYQLLVPAEEIANIDQAASLFHGMMLNNFTFGAYHVTGDVAAFVEAMHTAITGNRWMCGFPEKLVIISVGDYVVSAFGNGELIANFTGCEIKYNGAPTFAYEVDYFTIDKSGALSFDDRADSEVIESRARFAFVRVENGKIEALFYPKLKSSPLEQFSEEQREALMSGKTIISSVKFDGGSSSSAFVQVDQETLQVVAAPTAIITRNLKVLADELGLSASEVKCIQNGEPLTFIIDDEQTTVGIDLNEKVGLRITEGDANKWREQNKRICEKYTFGCYGCWIMDNEGNLDYVREEDFTEELWEEQRKSAQRNVSSSLHK